jgi:hypothetical protein
MSTTNYRRGVPITLATLSTDTVSASATIDGYDNANVTVVLAAGTGSAVFQFEVAYVAGGARFPLIPEGASSPSITETAAGNYHYDVALGRAVELYVNATDIATQSYTLAATVWPFSK